MSDFIPKPPREVAPSFHAHMPQTAPLSIEQLDILLRLITAAKAQVKSFASLGADLAVLTGAILNEHPQARGLMVDFSRDTSKGRHRQLPGNEPNLTVTKLAQSGMDCYTAMARFAPLDTVILGSQLHLRSTEKRVLFTEIFRLLNPGGLLLCLGDFPSVTRRTESPRDDYFIEALFGEELRRNAGKSPAEIAREYYERIADNEFAIAPVEVQCDWLSEAGFAWVDCYSKVDELTVLGGQRPEQ